MRDQRLNLVKRGISLSYFMLQQKLVNFLPLKILKKKKEIKYCRFIKFIVYWQSNKASYMRGYNIKLSEHRPTKTLKELKNKQA